MPLWKTSAIESRRGRKRPWIEKRERLEEVLAPVEELDETAEVLARAALITGGYHRHKRGEWRKRREQ